MELSQLIMFKAVVEQGSIIRASESLHCVPSNITNRIKLLEQELGISLFIRTGRGLVVSPSGEIFKSYTDRILALCHEARSALAPASEPSGTLRIGAIESSATGRLPKLLSRYNQHYPAVQMHFSTNTWPKLLNDVIHHKLDGAILAVNNHHPDIDHLKLYKEELVLITPFSTTENITPRDLSGASIFMWPEGCPYRETLEKWLNKHKVRTSITSIANYGTIFGCVSSGAGISLVPKGIFDQFKNMDNINGHTFDDLPSIQNYFIWNTTINPHRARDKFSELLQSEFNIL